MFNEPDGDDQDVLCGSVRRIGENEDYSLYKSVLCPDWRRREADTPLSVRENAMIGPGVALKAAMGMKLRLWQPLYAVIIILMRTLTRSRQA